MTWPNRLGKLKHKFIKEKDMKAEAIQALQLFKQQHLARPVVAVDDGQADMVSESLEQTKENEMEYASVETSSRVPKKKGVNFNYPDHYKPLKDRIMSALNNGNRTAEAVANYCKEETKLVNLQLGRWVSRGMIGRQTNKQSGITRFYPHDIALEMGILTAPQPINYNTKARRAEKAEQKRSSPVQTNQPTQAEAFVLRGETVGITDKSNAKEEKYIEFLEKRMVEWQVECRKMAKEISDLETTVLHSRAEIAKASNAPRNVTGEVAEVMKEVTELRATVAYLESKLFGSK